MIKEFKVGVRHVVNLGNYETMHVEAEVAVVCEDEDWESCRRQAQIALEQLLRDSYSDQRRPEWFARIASKRRAQ